MLGTIVLSRRRASARDQNNSASGITGAVVTLTSTNM